MITLETYDLAKRFGRKIVFNDVEIQFKGSVLGIGGANGSGKSTLLKCLAGLLRPSAGLVKWQTGGEKRDGPLPRKNIGYAAPYVNHYAELSVAGNLDFISRLRSLEQGKERIAELLDILGILHQKDVPFGLLSSGQQQRVKLAAALLDKPQVLFLDEPGTNLDKQGSETVYTLIHDYVKAGGAVMLASNNGKELSICDEVIVLETLP
ncbi:MAG: ABC transporter ATP-binding protein [Balneolales bacterium]